MKISRLLAMSFIAVISISGKAQGDGVLSISDNMIFEHFYLTAMQNKLSGDYSKAFEMISTCRNFQHKNLVVFFVMSRLMSGTQHYDYASDFANEAVENDTTGNVYYINMAIASNLRAGRVDKALDMYDVIIRQEPDNLDNYFQKYSILMSQKEYEKVLEFLETIPANDEATEYEIDVRYFDCYVAMEKYSKARKIVNKLYKKDENSARTNYLMSRLYFSQKKYTEAIQYCKRATELPGGESYYFTLAGLYDSQKMDSLYADACRSAFLTDEISKDTKVARFYDMLTSSDGRSTDKNWRGLFESVMSILSKQYPEDTGICALRETFYTSNNEEDAGLKVLENFVKNYPADDYIWRTLILKSHDVPDSVLIGYTERAMTDVPDQTLYYILNGQFLQTDGQYVESISPLKKAYVMLSEENAEQVKDLRSMTLHLLATGYFYADSVEMSYAYYDQLLSEDPNDAVALNNYSYHLAVKGQRLDEAEKMSMRCLTLQPLNSTYLDTYAYILFRRQKYQEALFVMERCMDNATEVSYEEYDHYGDILYFVDRKDEAIIQWKKALDIIKDNMLIKKKVENGQYYSE